MNNKKDSTVVNCQPSEFLSASIGCSLLALLAGTQPKIMPMAAEKPTPSRIADI